MHGRYPKARISVDSLTDLFTATCEYSYTTEQPPAYFDRGQISIQPPRPEELKNKGPLLTEIPADHSVGIGWFDGHDLLDPSVILHPLAHPAATGERIDKLEG